MKNDLSVDFEIGFADSCIQSYFVKGSSLTLLLECWNSVIVEIEFLNFASLFSMNYFRVADLNEVFESPLLERVLSELYEEKPKAHNYRVFKFINSDDLTVLEIVCEGIKIQKK